MEATQGLLLAVGWFVIRFGLPVLITWLLIWALLRADSRWQQEAQVRRRELIKKGILPVVKCWVMNECPPEKRENCPGYEDKSTPCWQVFRDAKGNLQEQCLGCRVFRSAPIPVVDH